MKTSTLLIVGGVVAGGAYLWYRSKGSGVAGRYGGTAATGPQHQSSANSGIPTSQLQQQYNSQPPTLTQKVTGGLGEIGGMAACDKWGNEGSWLGSTCEQFGKLGSTLGQAFGGLF